MPEVIKLELNEQTKEFLRETFMEKAEDLGVNLFDIANEYPSLQGMFSAIGLVTEEDMEMHKKYEEATMYFLDRYKNDDYWR